MADGIDSSSSDEALYNLALKTLFLLAPPTFIALRFLQAPYGKHHRPGWGPSLPAPLAWFLMESPSLFLTLYLFPNGRHVSSSLKPYLLIAPYLLHYLNRTLLYPLRLFRLSSSTSAPYPLSIAAIAFCFNLLNAYLQTRSISHYTAYDGDASHVWFWLRYLIGLGLFAFGMKLNVTSDKVLVGLKSAGGYQIPRGGCFEVVSVPNYLGEIVEWLGWALLCWSWAGLGFWVYTCANLVPRARANHLWYLQKFKEEYPKNRRAVIPYLY